SSVALASRFGDDSPYCSEIVPPGPATGLSASPCPCLPCGLEDHRQVSIAGSSRTEAAPRGGENRAVPRETGPRRERPGRPVSHRTSPCSGPDRASRPRGTGVVCRGVAVPRPGLGGALGACLLADGVGHRLGHAGV